MIIYYGINSVYKPLGVLEPHFATGGLMMSFFYLQTEKDTRFKAVCKYRRKAKKRKDKR